MNTRIFPGWILLLTLSSPLSLPAATSAWFVDGVSAGNVLGWDGGDARLAGAATGAGGVATGRLGGGVSYAPMTLRVPFPPEPAVAAWVNAMASGPGSPRRVVVADADATGKLLEAYELQGAVLAEVELPEFNAARTSPAVMRVVLTGTAGRAVSPPAVLGALSSPISSAGFQLTIPGIDGAGVSRIESIKVASGDSQLAPLSGVTGGKSLTGPRVANILVTVAHARVATWQAWLDESVRQGVPVKRDGAIVLLSPTMRASSASLNLHGCSLVRLSRPPDSAGVPAYYLAELACERISFGGLPAPAAPTAAFAATRTPVAAKAGDGVDPTPPASVVPAESERGARDPAQFPRVSGLTRTNYSGTFQRTYTNETASYAAAEKIGDLVARVEAAATAAGWELRNLTESGSSQGRQVSQSWRKNTASAELTFIELKDRNTTQMNLAVMLQRAGATDTHIK